MMVLEFGWGSVGVFGVWIRDLNLIFKNGKSIDAILARNKQTKKKKKHQQYRKKFTNIKANRIIAKYKNKEIKL